MWLDQSMRWLGTPSGKRGRSPTFSDAAIQFCLSIKCLFGQPLRQALRMVQSLLPLEKVDWSVPDSSTVCRRQKTLQVQLSYQPKPSPLNLLVDRAGIKFLGEGEWKRKKHGAEYRCEWLKVHLGIEAQALEVRAIEVTSNAIDVAPMLRNCSPKFPLTNPLQAFMSAVPTTPGTAWMPLLSDRRRR